MQFLTPTEVRQRLRISKTTLVRRIKCPLPGATATAGAATA